VSDPNRPPVRLTKTPLSGDTHQPTPAVPAEAVPLDVGPAVPPSPDTPPTLAASPETVASPEHPSASSSAPRPVALIAVVAAVALAAVLGGGVAIGLAAGHRSAAPLTGGGPQATITQTASRPLTDAPSPSVTPTSTVPTIPAPAQTDVPTSTGMKNVCWDGSQVSHSRCPQATGPRALQYAFPQLDLDSCTNGAGVGDHFHPDWSYRCTWRGNEYHVAEYISETTRTQRLAEYGVCQQIGPGQCIAGPTAEGKRYVKTYTEESGLLFFVSSPQGLPALNAILPRSAAVLTWGMPAL
jgi:hypothetical protein